MPNIVIFPESSGGWNSSAGQHVNGVVIAEDGGGVNYAWTATFPSGALASTMNDACKDAAVAALADAGITVGPLDKKTLFVGAVQLSL